MSTAVISSSDSVTAKNTLNSLNESTVATLTADKIDASNIGDLSDYDVLYIDKSVVETGGFNASAVEEYVSNGGSVFLDNDVYNVFDKDFIGAEDFVTINSCPVDMIYPENSDKGIKKIQSLLSDFSMLYRNYADYNDVLVNQNYGVGVVPSTAECIASKDNVGIYTVNQYGNGYVFFTNPLLPNSFSVNNLSPDDTGEYLSATTVGANKLLRDYFAEFVSLKNYGYAVEHVLGSFAKPVASWELHYEDITGIDNGSAEIFEEMCERYGQVPSFTLARNPYIWFRRAESVTYALNNNGQFAMDPYENAYSSGTHFVTAKEWLSLDYDDNTISYFEAVSYTHLIIYLGRMDNQVKVKGNRIELGEIENAAMCVGGVKGACAVFDEKNQKIVLFIESCEAFRLRKLNLELKKYIPNYMLPGDLVVMEKFPHTANDKIDRVTLKKSLG